MPHRARPALLARHPVHATLRVVPGFENLRRKEPFREIRRAIAAGCDRLGFRLVHYSIQSNHMHLIIEAEDQRALARGLQGLQVRIARALNGLFRRRGRVFADRYHARALKTPREVRNALAYVILNHRKHSGSPETRSAPGIDPCSSGAYFDLWISTLIRPPENGDLPVASPRTWLLRVGWRRHGLLSPREVPGARA